MAFRDAIERIRRKWLGAFPASVFCIMSDMRIAVLLVTLNLGIAFGQDFAHTMKNVFKGNQFKDYQWLNYPVNDFGVGTSYKTTGTTIDNRGFLCATFTCLSISPIPSGNDWVNVKPKDAAAFADAACGGPVDDALKRESKIAASALLPKLLSVVGLTASIDSDKTLDTQLTFTSACTRMLISGKFRTYLRGLKDDTYELKDSFQKGMLVVVAGDVIIDGLTLTVKPTSKLKVDIEAKLQGSAVKTFGDGAKGTVSVSRTSEGTYKLSSKSPLIVGLYGVKQKTALTSSSEAGWDTWDRVILPEPPTRK